jgi:hypothetical protein
VKASQLEKQRSDVGGGGALDGEFIPHCFCCRAEGYMLTFIMCGVTCTVFVLST